jgi:F-type H+-transporting ATPase subunit epsilon
MSSTDYISLVILTPEATLMEKRVSKISLPGSKGRFMILKDHAPIISSLEEGDVIFESDGVTENVNIMSGFVEVNNNVVTVCAEL